jgi:hypothetical protein
MAFGHIYCWVRMHLFRGLFSPAERFLRHQFSADYTISMFGFRFRQGQGFAFFFVGPTDGRQLAHRSGLKGLLVTDLLQDGSRFMLSCWLTRPK